VKAVLPLAVIVALASPALGQTVEELQTQLKAQQQINALLKQRIRGLEEQLATAQGRAAPKAEHRPVPAPSPEDQLADEEERALERALERRGIAVLPPWKVELTPGFSWSHSGSNSNTTRRDSFAAALDARVGLPGGWMVGAGVPVRHNQASGIGNNTGLGDATVRVWKNLVVQGETWPSVVASVHYTTPLGEDFTDTKVPLGSGFHRVGGTVSASKSVDPIAFFGSVSYSHAFERNDDGAEQQPGVVVGLGIGATLAVTPEISMTAAFDFGFSDEAQIDGKEVASSSGTFGMFELGTGILLTRGVFLTLTGGLGITDDSPDLSLGVALPIRF
jgi:hypothetical protein